MQSTFSPYYKFSSKDKQQTLPRRQVFTPKNKQTKPRTTRLAVEHTVRYIGVCNDPGAYRSVVRAAPNTVVKAICNAALNVERGSIQLSPAQKALFRQNRGKIARLTSKRVGLPSKRRLLEQRGGAFWIPALIGAAISGLGSALFGGSKSS